MSFTDHLIPNSAWKDYSTNTNYAFEAFEPEEKIKNGHRNETLQKKPITRPTGRPPSIPPPGYAAPKPNPGGYMGDTRSLQRPRGAYQPPMQERSTLSLPRTVYDRNRAPKDMQPDFYFMPSQRKYSGM